jgi:phospholipid-binding lipoprotein MlaA
MERSRPNRCQIIADSGRCILIALLVVLAGGCASTHGNRYSGAGSGSQVDEPARGLFVPVAAESEVPEPTVIEPTVVGYADYHDPLIRINRAVFAFNDVTYRYLLIPLSKQYVRVVPEPVQQSIGNFFTNLKTPIYFANHLIQLQTKPMFRSLHRFGINTTVGLLGLFDPATDRYGIARAEASFEDSLIHYGATYGAYLVLPLFGPSDVRNGISLVVDQFLNPIPYLIDSPESVIIQGFDHFQEFAPEAEQYEVIHRESEDPYIFLRNLYLQGIQRDVEY